MAINAQLQRLTTEQRATALGQLLTTNPGDATPGNAGGNTNTSTQTFRPLVLDLDGNGITLTTQAQGGNVLLDVDGDGFAEETQWIGPRDGELTCGFIFDQNDQIRMKSELNRHVAQG
jgi:hypothetical protein